MIAVPRNRLAMLRNPGGDKLTNHATEIRLHHGVFQRVHTLVLKLRVNDGQEFYAVAHGPIDVLGGYAKWNFGLRVKAVRFGFFREQECGHCAQPRK